jgi:hypothetical protein
LTTAVARFIRLDEFEDAMTLLNCRARRIAPKKTAPTAAKVTSSTMRSCCALPMPVGATLGRRSM